MIITGPEGYLPVQKKTARRVSPAGVNRPQSPEGCFDNYTASAAAEQDGRSFREAVANLSYQVRTHNTTGKIQELRGAGPLRRVPDLPQGDRRPDAPAGG